MLNRIIAIALLFFMSSAISAVKAQDISKSFIPTTPPLAAPALPFIDPQNPSLNLDNFKGRYILLNIWATWCGPCTHEMASLNTLRTQTDPKKLEIIALSEDRDPLSAASAFYTRHNLTHLHVYGDPIGGAPSLLHIQGLPTTLLIDPQGMEIGRIEGDIDWSSPLTLAFLKNTMKL